MTAILIALALLQASATPTPAERVAIFKAAGFKPTGARWLACDKRSPLELEVRDINGDRQPDAIVTDAGSYCYGHTEQGFVLLTKRAGVWAKLYASPGIPTFLPARVRGWPELEVGGPGFCFPVLRFNGATFVEARRAYEGKPCR